jgi:hypothetical protein
MDYFIHHFLLSVITCWPLNNRVETGAEIKNVSVFTISHPVQPAASGQQSTIYLQNAKN